jgi:DNA modification methylase
MNFITTQTLTNAENRAQIYEGTGDPTIPSEITPDTPLSEINLNWRERDLPERERTKHVHRLHSYLGKYIPQLVEIFLRKYFVVGQTVIDPFCGSGTTLVQANELGINSIGYDISIFNVMLCQAKTQEYKIDVVEKEIKDVLHKLHVATQSRKAEFADYDSSNEKVYQLSLLEKTSRIADVEYLNNWFAPQALNELLTFLTLIEEEDYKYKNLLKILLSRAARSSRLTTHFDLDFPKKPQTEPYWCYKHSRTCFPVQEAYKFLSRYSMDTIRRVQEFAKLRTNAQVDVFHEDSRIADIPLADGVITSPPYVGLIDYHDQHAYAYHLLGLKDRSNDEIGAASNGTSIKAKKKYQEDIADVFKRVAVSIKSGGKFIVVAGDRSNLYGDIAKLAGLEEEAILHRHVNRRTGRRSTEFFESIFIWRKP